MWTLQIELMPYLPNNMRLFSIVWQKTFRKGPQKKLVNNNIGVVCVCSYSRKSSSFTWQANDGMGGGQNSLSGLHVHASTNQFFLPGTNAKRLEYRLDFFQLCIVDSSMISRFFKGEKILRGSLDLIPSPSRSGEHLIFLPNFLYK